MDCLKTHWGLCAAICLLLSSVRLARADDAANRADERRFREKLNQPAELRAVQQTVHAILEQILTAHGLPVDFDDAAFSTTSSPLDESIDLSARGVTLRSILNQILKPRGLAWHARDGQFEITLEEKLQAELVVRHYPATGLSSTDSELLRLAELVTRFAAPESWDEQGGTGSLRVIRGGMMVRQSPLVHAEIESMLRDLQAAIGPGIPDDNLPFGPEDRVIISDEQILVRLQERVDVDFQQADFTACLEKLRELIPVPLWFNEALSKEEGATISRDRTLELKQATLESVLNRVLADTELGWSIVDGGILIAVKGNLLHSFVKLYPVSDLPDSLVLVKPIPAPQGNAGDIPGGGMGGGGGFGGGGQGFFQLGGQSEKIGWNSLSQTAPADANADRPGEGIAGMLEEIVAPESWTTRGGSGVIERYRDHVLVRHSPECHHQIANALSGMRKVVAGIDPAARGAKQMSEEGLSSVLYRCQGETGENLRQMLLRLDDESLWEPDGASPASASRRGRIATVGQGLVICQTAAQHRRIHHWLERMGVLEQVVELDGTESD